MKWKQQQRQTNKKWQREIDFVLYKLHRYFRYYNFEMSQKDVMGLEIGMRKQCWQRVELLPG